jgi:hypothetical protein
MFAAARNDFKRREGWGDADRYHQAVVRLKQWQRRRKA